MNEILLENLKIYLYIALQEIKKRDSVYNIVSCQQAALQENLNRLEEGESLIIKKN